MREKRNSFIVRYHWSAATMPPPDHYEYTIQIGPENNGSIQFIPDYSNFDPPQWEEQFPLTDEQLTELYQLITQQQLTDQEWKRLDPAPVGGSLAWATISINDKEYPIPAKIKDHKRVQPFYQLVKSFVPTAVWDQLRHKQQLFQENYR